MGNVYTDKKTGLKIMEVEYGWGMDMNAIEFPLDLAYSGLNAGMYFLKKNPTAQRPSILMMMNYCSDVIDNAKNGETTYILDRFWKEQVDEIKQLIK